jgi:outer membrane protein TolC
MYRNIVSVICGCLLTFGVFAQNAQEETLLKQIEQNNKQLQAYQSYIVSRQLSNKTENNLPDPQVSAFYLPFGEHATGDYSEYQVSQSFDFPTVYAARGEQIEMQKKLLELEYAQLRQEVLLVAKNQLLELHYLKQKKELVRIRAEQAMEVYDQIQKLFDAEQVGILELNKAKVAWLQDQFEVEQLEIEMQNVLLILQKLNGGERVEVNEIDLILAPDIAPIEIIWEEKLLRDAEIKLLENREVLALQQIKLEKNKVLPDISIGYNYQGVNSETYSGFMGGLSIPLWNSKNKVKAAKANYEYEQSNTVALTAEHYTEFQERYNQYILLQKKFKEYQETLGNLNTEELLYKAYNLGEISYMEYYLELQFYRTAYNKLLEMQKELFQLKAELLKHQL